MILPNAKSVHGSVGGGLETRSSLPFLTDTQRAALDAALASKQRRAGELLSHTVPLAQLHIQCTKRLRLVRLRATCTTQAIKNSLAACVVLIAAPAKVRCELSALLALLSSRVLAPLTKVTPAQSSMAGCSLCSESVLRSSAPSKGLAVHGQTLWSLNSLLLCWAGYAWLRTSLTVASDRPWRVTSALAASCCAWRGSVCQSLTAHRRT